MYKTCGRLFLLAGTACIILSGLLLVDFFDPDGIKANLLIVASMACFGFFAFIFGLYLWEYEDWKKFEQDYNELMAGLGATKGE